MWLRSIKSVGADTVFSAIVYQILANILVKTTCPMKLQCLLGNLSTCHRDHDPETSNLCRLRARGEEKQSDSLSMVSMELRKPESKQCRPVATCGITKKDEKRITWRTWSTFHCIQKYPKAIAIMPCKILRVKRTAASLSVFWVQGKILQSQHPQLSGENMETQLRPRPPGVLVPTPASHSAHLAIVG